ncbi:DUF1801 domain-containing protein [Rheinheimera marina]|uniref:DUF1801 domain-containing protein n=1 Tax=Rheinheimera marina TaxID=1774958 RepID=A0ABV9JGD3_9GAMM
MADNKTQPTGVAVTDYLAAIEKPARRADCERLVQLMQGVVGEGPVMWGPSIVGFGSYHYKYASGREGDMCLIGFANRKAEISLYVLSCGEIDQQQELLLSQLGKFRKTVACIYIKKLADIDLAVLEQLIRYSMQQTRSLYLA